MSPHGLELGEREKLKGERESHIFCKYGKIKLYVVVHTTYLLLLYTKSIKWVLGFGNVYYLGRTSMYLGASFIPDPSSTVLFFVY